MCGLRLSRCARIPPAISYALPKEIKTLGDALDSDDVRLRTSIAIKLLEGVGTFVGQREEEQRLIMSGALLDMLVKKAET